MSEKVLTFPERYLFDNEEFIRVELNNEAVLVAARCPHKGALLISESKTEGPFLVCERHGATFDLRTGAWVRGPQCGNIRVKPLSAAPVSDAQ